MVRRSRIREISIVSFVGAHFLLGSLALTHDDSVVRRVPLLGRTVDFYDERGLAQRWGMFAPPPRRARYLLYSAAAPATEPRPPRVLFGERLGTAAGGLVTRRGTDRLANLAGPLDGDLDLADDPVRRHFFDSLIRFLCARDRLGRATVRIELSDGALGTVPGEGAEDATSSIVHQRECP